MNQERLARVLRNMQECGLPQMLICAPSSIFYLTGKDLDPGERFFALYLRQDGAHCLFVNNLFSVPEDLGVEKIWFSDMDDAVGCFCEHTLHDQPLGIDKDLPARFLLPMMERGAASDYIEASICVDQVRMHKDADEQMRMRRASRINDRAMGIFQKLLMPGITELEVAEQMEKIYRSLGAEGNSFEPSVCFGANAAVNHHVPDQTPLREGDCVLLDVGCRLAHYCADMTRTFFFGSVSEAHRKVYEVVRRAQETAEALVRPGVQFCDIDLAARKIIRAEGYGDYFFNRVGHSIGLDVHEIGDVSWTHREPVEPGMIFSIEPGIYIPGNVGVRIEDLVLVTETGCEVLNHFPHDLCVVKAQA